MGHHSRRPATKIITHSIAAVLLGLYPRRRSPAQKEIAYNEQETISAPASASARTTTRYVEAIFPPDCARKLNGAIVKNGKYECSDLLLPKLISVHTRKTDGGAFCKPRCTCDFKNQTAYCADKFPAICKLPPNALYKCVDGQPEEVKICLTNDICVPTDEDNPSKGDSCLDRCLCRGKRVVSTLSVRESGRCPLSMTCRRLTFLLMLFRSVSKTLTQPVGMMARPYMIVARLEACPSSGKNALLDVTRTKRMADALAILAPAGRRETRADTLSQPVATLTTAPCTSAFARTRRQRMSARIAMPCRDACHSDQRTMYAPTPILATATARSLYAVKNTNPSAHARQRTSMARSIRTI